jgi:hypothetical protein
MLWCQRKMEYRIIPHSILKKKLLEQFFPTTNEWRNDITPDGIYMYAKKEGYDLRWARIPDWEGYEYRCIDIDDDTFLSYLIEEGLVLEGPLDIITHFCFPERIAYQISFNDLEKFIKEVYPEIVQADFFQPLDLLLISFPDKFISMIHHEGYYCHIKLT